MRRCFKLFKLALTAALFVGILLVTDINRLNVPEQIGKNHLFSILDWEVSKLPDKWSYKIKSLLKNDEQTKSKRFVNIYSYFNDGKNNLYGISTEDVEASIENLISEAIKFEGLTYLRRIIFPPVLITLDSAPNILITSPREKILRILEVLDQFLTYPRKKSINQLLFLQQMGLEPKLK